MTGARSPAAGYLRFLVWAVVVTAAVALVGYLPTLRLAGESAVPALIAGCAVGLLASLAGGAPVALMPVAAAPEVRYRTTMLAMAVRFVVALALGLAAALSGLVPVRPLLVWVAIVYVVLLAVDTWYAVKGF